MYLFEMVSFDPIEVQGETKYCHIAGDGESFLLLDQSAPRLQRMCPRLRLGEAYETSRRYAAVCYDSREDCYWACCRECSEAVFKLNRCFQEIDRCECADYQACHGAVQSIAYDRCSDALLLTYRCGIVELSKAGFRQRAVRYRQEGLCYSACIRVGEHHCYISRQGRGQQLTVADGEHTLIQAGIPAGYRVLGMAETDVGACGKSTVNLLAVKHGKYHYLLRGVLVSCPDGIGGSCEPEPRVEDCRRHCESDIHCGEVRPAGCTPAFPVDSCIGHREEEAQQGCCPSHRESCQDRDEGEICWKGHPHGCGHHFGIPHNMVELEDSCAALIQSIALEQTAISHILNAEGEKIQKVVAVSNRPADFLDVNHSVLELVNKLTHLEQVLYSKLELACGVLHGRHRQS